MRRHFQNEVRLKHLSQSGHFASGNPRWYYGKKGTKRVPMPDAPKDSPEFLAAYVAASGSFPKPKPKSYAAGTIGAGVALYLGSSDFASLAESTRANRRGRCDDIRERYGAAQMTALSAKNIKTDLAKFEGNPANARLKVWRALCAYWDQMGKIDVNVARQVAPRKVAKTNGHTPWTRDDFKAFRDHWPIGTKERLAFELMYRTCAAIGDTTRLNASMLQDGWLTYTRQKSGSTATCPFMVDGPAWFEATDDLARCLEAETSNFTFLTTKFGKARSAKGAASWFSKAARAAGLEKGKTGHGIRKGRAAMFKENAATAEQRMAILGHETEAETQLYSKSADLRRTIEGTEKFQLSNQVPTQGANTLKNKGKKSG